MRNFFSSVLKTFASIKTGLILLAFLGIFSAIGSSLLPDMFYRLLLFKILIVLLFINLGLCTISRLIKMKKRLSAKSNLMGQIRQWGILILHAGIMLLLVGGMINASSGSDRTVSIAKGERAVIADDKNLSLLVKDFAIELYDEGVPSQYYSRVVMYRDKTPQLESVISVNNPLEYEGVKVYQQSYGYRVDVTVEGRGKAAESTLYEGEMIAVPGGNWSVKVFKYIPDFDPAYGMESKSMQPNNPRVIYSIYQGEVLTGIGAAAWGDIVEIDETASVQFNRLKPYSVLKVKEDPGLPYAAAGGIVFMAGVAMAEINIFRKTGNKKVAEEYK